MTKKEQILREEIRRVIKQILEAEEAPEEKMPEEEPDEEEMPEEEPAGDEEEDFSGRIDNLTSKYMAKLKDIPTSDEMDNIVNVAAKVVGSFGLAKDEVMGVLRGIKKKLVSE
jgi:hypothetical protein